MNKICKKCGKTIRGAIKILQYRVRVGNKFVLHTDFYDEDCFYYLNLKEAQNEIKKRNNKKTNKK